MNNKEKGAFSIDAILGLTLFMIAIIAIMFMSLIIRVQANMQYALGQTAKEISGYYYLMDKLGIASVTSNENNTDTKKNIENLNSTIGSILDFSSSASNLTNGMDFKDGLTLESLQNLEKEMDLDKIWNQANTMGEKLKTYTQKGTATDQLKAVIQVFGKSLISKSFSYYIAPFVCEALMPKYLTSTGDVDEYYESIGINPDSVDFSDSQLLFDGRSIKLVVEYELDTEKLTFGMYKGILKFQQVAATAAWIQPNGGSKKAVSDIKLPEEDVKNEESTE